MGWRIEAKARLAQPGDGSNGEKDVGRKIWKGMNSVITLGFIEELDNEGRLMENEYTDFGVTDQECDNMGEMCDPYEGLEDWTRKQ